MAATCRSDGEWNMTKVQCQNWSKSQTHRDVFHGVEYRATEAASYLWYLRSRLSTSLPLCIQDPREEASFLPHLEECSRSAYWFNFAPGSNIYQIPARSTQPCKVMNILAICILVASSLLVSLLQNELRYLGPSQYLHCM